MNLLQAISDLYHNGICDPVCTLRAIKSESHNMASHFLQCSRQHGSINHTVLKLHLHLLKHLLDRFYGTGILLERLHAQLMFCTVIVGNQSIDLQSFQFFSNKKTG